MKLSVVVFGVLAAFAVSLAAEIRTPILASRSVDAQPDVAAGGAVRPKRGLLLAGAGVGLLGAAALGAGAVGLGAGLIGAKAGFIGGALAGGALNHGRSYGGWGYGGGYGGYGSYGGYYGGYGGGYRTYYPTTYYVSNSW